MTRFRKGAIYTRISKDRTGEELGVQRQGEDNNALATARGIPVDDAHRYVDNDLSATKGGKRPGYAALMEAVERGEVDVIIVWMLGRLWRNRRERAEGIEKLRKHGVSVLCAKGPELDLTTAAGRLLAGLLGEVDTHEVEQKSEREQRAMRQRVEQGKAPGGPRCFGYGVQTGTKKKLDQKTGQEIEVPVYDMTKVVPDEAREVKAAFNQLLAGASVSGIARGLNERNIPNRNGKAWSHNSVRGMLLNEHYAGLREYHGDLYPGVWPAIVSEDTWRAAKAVLLDEGRKTSPGPARRWLLSGIALCGICDDGTTVTSAYRGKSKTKGRESEMERIYRCRDSKHLARLAEPIDFMVEEYVTGRLARPDAVELLVDDDQPNIGELRAQALALRGRLDALAAEFAEDDDAEPREFREASRRLRERIAEVEAKMAHPQRARVLADVITAEDPSATWYDLPLDRKRAALDVLVTVTILRGKAGRRPFDEATVRIEPKKRDQG
ncbi:recombinase family protein [Streptomyces sp. RPT161]|uniref:recombinase family protein n=1 Tax=Streptomyces sp. RPT161 TaxID=3015993 RepID=UPI0022B89EBC|nr:recombinase family protein [Streptomyces sp. RPT161]